MTPMEIELTLQQLMTLIDNYSKTHLDGTITDVMVDSWFSRYGRIKRDEEELKSSK